MKRSSSSSLNHSQSRGRRSPLFQSDRFTYSIGSEPFGCPVPWLERFLIPRFAVPSRAIAALAAELGLVPIHRTQSFVQLPTPHIGR